MLRRGSTSNHSAYRKVKASTITQSTQKISNLQLLDLENCSLDRTALQNLLNQPPSKIPNYRPRLNLKIDVEAIREQRDRAKKQNLSLQKQIMMMRLQLNTLKGEIKRLKEFQGYFEAKHKDDNNNNNNTEQKTENLTIMLQRKQMMEIKTALVEKDNQIAKLRKMPTSSMLMELEVDRQHLIEETIRLKAYIASRVEEPATEEMVAEVARLLKQENQKLKGALRLCEHQKMLAKAKKSSIKRLNVQLEKDLTELKQKLRSKQAEVDMLSHQNKNLMLKKVNQLRVIQESKDREEIERLQGQISQAEAAKKTLQIQNKDMKDQLQSLKEKQKVIIQSQSQMQDKYDGLVRYYQQKLQLAEQQIKSFKQNYRVPVTDARKSFWNTPKQPHHQLHHQPHHQLHHQLPATLKPKPIRITQIRAQLLHLRITFRRNRLNLNDVFKNPCYKLRELQKMFSEPPFLLPSANALKFARYLIEDNSREGSLDPEKSEQRTVLLSILRTCMRDWSWEAGEGGRDENQMQDNWEKTIRVYSDRMIRKIGDMAKKGPNIILEEIEHMLYELCIKKTPKEMAYLEAKIYGDGFNQDAQYSLDKFSQFVQSCLPDSQNPQ